MHMIDHRQDRCCAERGAAFKLPSVDTLGMVASGLCLVHCLVLPVLVALLPAVMPAVVHDDRTHYFLAFFVTMFCIFAIVPGYLRHSNRQVLALMVPGLTLVLFATFVATVMLGDAWEIPLISVGNLLVVAAHWTNRRLLSSC